MRLLLVEDKDSFRRLLVQALEGSSWETCAVGDPREALEIMAREPFEVLVTDLRLPGLSGLELLKRARRLQPTLRIILMSAFGEPEDIVEAMRHGADGFLPKPFDLHRFLELLDHLHALAGAPPPDPQEPWVAFSPAMRSLDQALSQAAERDIPVLFLGEAGVGKVRAGRRLHLLRQPRSPFLLVEAGGMPLPAPRLRLLRGGTLFIQGLDLLTQEQMSGVLESLESAEGREVRWMASAAGLEGVHPALRERLGVLQLTIPPLRERREDIVPLFRALLASAARAEGRTPPILDRAHEQVLLRRTWDGNAREVAWLASQALRATVGAVLAPLGEVRDPGGPPPLHLPWPSPGTLADMLQQVTDAAEARLLAAALEAHGGDPAHAARALGLTLRTLTQRLRDHGIPLSQ